jgi:hypothetical protein
MDYNSDLEFPAIICSGMVYVPDLFRIFGNRSVAGEFSDPAIFKVAFRAQPAESA